MKLKSFAALLMALLMTFALAEETAYSFGEHIAIPAPADMTAEENEGVITLVRGSTRAVVQLIPQELSDEPLKQADRLISAYDPTVTDVELAHTAQGYALARGVIEHCFGDGLHQYPLLALTPHGLLIISAYDLEGNNAAAQALLAELATLVEVDGEKLQLPE